jgi:hypothetical protein
MKRKIVFATILGLLAIIAILAALFIPSVAHSDQNVISASQHVASTDQSTLTAGQSASSVDQNVPSVADSSQSTDPTITGNSIIYTNGGTVTLHLPPGGGALANHPTDLQIIASHVYAGDNFGGTGDTLQVLAWVPTLNSYVPVAVITNNPNPQLYTWLKGLLAGSPAEQNIIQIQGSPDPLEVHSTGDIATAYLTMPININIGDPFPSYFKALNFTLPPLTLEFHPIGAAFQSSTTTKVPSSGWTILQSAWVEPAWTRVWIPQWLGSGPLAMDGTITLDANVTYISP